MLIKLINGLCLVFFSLLIDFIWCKIVFLVLKYIGEYKTYHSMDFETEVSDKDTYLVSQLIFTTAILFKILDIRVDSS